MPRGVPHLPTHGFGPRVFPLRLVREERSDPSSLGNNICCGGDSLHSQLMAFVIDYTFVLAFNQLQQLFIPTSLAQQ